MARAVEAVRRSCETDTWQQVDVGPAGTAWRFGLALALATPGAKVVLEGHARLQERPIEPLVKALRSLGAELEGGVPPHRCTGRRLRGGPCTLDASASSGPLGLGITGIAGIALWITGLVGESIADAQLSRFRRNPANRGQVCQEGLWAWSRHPNYFFEWMVWVGYAVFASGAPWGWTGWLSPLLMLHFLLNVTGIPMTEELSVKSKGEAYRRYQRTTSAFFPWRRKTEPAAG